MPEENFLKKWEQDFRRRIVARVLEAGIEFNVENIPAIVRETSYAVQSKKHPEDCPCYTSEPCHFMHDLNCLLCPCPNYNSDRLGDNGEIEGGCRVKSEMGKWKNHPNLPAGRVWDCNGCSAYHSPTVVEDYLRKHLEDFQRVAEEIRARK